MKYNVKNEEIEINIGDSFLGTDIYTFGNTSWCHRYTIKNAEQALRFDQPNVLLTVDIECIHSDGTHRIIDHNTKRWLEQCS